MPPELLDSQYAALEPLDAEPGITVDLAATPDQIADKVLRALGPPSCWH